MPSSSSSSRTGRRGGVSDDDYAERAIAALHEVLATPRPSARLGALLAEQEAAASPDPPELSPAQRKLRTNFERDNKALTKRISAEVGALNDKFAHRAGPQYDKMFPPQRDLLHVFGADVDGTAKPFSYLLAWTNVEGFQGVGSEAGADVRTGTFLASEFTTSGWLHAHAALGVRFSPVLQQCHLSIRPVVNWHGVDILQHRVFDPDQNERRWAAGEAALTILVQSSEPDGGTFNVDGRLNVPLWSRSEENPVGSRDYGGTENGPGFLLQVLASSSRRYNIWVICRASAFADPGFAVATRASASGSCQLPYLVVEEIPG